ncbi:hypothetical protein Tco_0493321 [Tanacetum coccineum]
MKDARYPDFGLELLVPEHMWIDDVCTYDISATLASPTGGLIDKSSILSDMTLHCVIKKSEHTCGFSVSSGSKPTQDTEDLNLLLLQGHLDHLPRWDATGYEFKHDYTIIKSPRAVVFPVDNDNRKIIRFNEIYKFSDGMLTRILEALDYIVKEFKNLECFVGGRVRDIDYRLLLRTE